MIAGGSHLFGLNTPKSDIDIKGLYLPSTVDTYEYSPDYLNFSTNQTNDRNSSEDIDIELYSIHKFFDMIKKGDTNSYDLLFSIFREDIILLNTPEAKVLKKHYTDLLSTNSKAFLGYVVSQTKKYGVKGERYKALTTIIAELENYVERENKKIREDSIKDFINYIIPKNLDYVKLIRREEEKSHKGGGVYLEVLNKEYRDTIKYEYFLEKLYTREKDYGERSKKSTSGVDYKSLSHALRIVFEFEELLLTHFITFPLKKRNMLLRVKKGDLSDFNNDYQKTLLFLDKKIDEINNKLIPESLLTDEIKFGIFNKLLIKMITLR